MGVLSEIIIVVILCWVCFTDTVADGVVAGDCIYGGCVAADVRDPDCGGI